MFRSSNPTLNENKFQAQEGYSGAIMTLSGTLGKTAIMFGLMLVTSIYSWMAANPTLLWVGLIGGLILAFTTWFKPEWSPITGPLYALVKGLAVGTISLIFAVQFAGTTYAGIVPLAMLGTFSVFLVMLGLYATRVIRVTDTFRMVVVGATLAIMITYMATFILGFFWPGMYQLPIYQASPIGIAFSCIAIIVAALNLALDFDLIETGVTNRAPKYIEWYAGFSLLVTLIWLYIEMLRLISKIANR